MSLNKTLLVIAVILVSLPLIASGCSSEIPTTSPASTSATTQPGILTATPIIQIITTHTASSMIQSNSNNPDFVILDVRTQEEFSAGHIANAIMIDIYLPDFKTKIGELDPNKKYLVYCRTARRSGDAVKIMSEMGFREVYDMAGGINQWIQDGYPIVKS